MLYDLKCALCNKNFQSDQPKAKGCSLECKLKRERIRKNNWLTNKYQTNPEYKQIILARGRASYKKFIQERRIRVANWRTSHKEWIKEYWRNPLKARARLRKKKWYLIIMEINANVVEKQLKNFSRLTILWVGEANTENKKG